VTKRILVVEDQEDNLQILRDLLTSAGFEIIEAKDGEEGVRAAEAERPDLILMDIQLPLLDGYEATRRIKADPALRAIPIIVVTSYALSGDEVKAREAGCDAMYPSRIARVSYWPKSVSSCRSVCAACSRRRGGRIALVFAALHMSGYGIVSRVTPVHTAVRNCTRDEGRPFEVGNQVLISSHRKLLLSKAMVVNVAEKSERDFGRYD
jgi:two-component system, cell cycle response regulator DivK